jgi:hypothetical protein
MELNEWNRIGTSKQTSFLVGANPVYSYIPPGLSGDWTTETRMKHWSNENADISKHLMFASYEEGPTWARQAHFSPGVR